MSRSKGRLINSELRGEACNAALVSVAWFRKKEGRSERELQSLSE